MHGYITRRFQHGTTLESVHHFICPILSELKVAFVHTVKPV